MSVTRSFRSSWGICWSGAVKRPDPGGPLAGRRRGRVPPGVRLRTQAALQTQAAQTTSVAATLTTEAEHVEQVEQVADGRHVAGHIGVVVVLHRIGQVVTTALAECAAQLPVASMNFTNEECS